MFRPMHPLMSNFSESGWLGLQHLAICNENVRRGNDMINIRIAEGEADIEEARTLFREYEEWLGLDLCFQGFEDELAGLPGKYAPPSGRLFLASFYGGTSGCIAIRGLDDGYCEMKRLYLRENARGHGIGKILVDFAISEARQIGYKAMRLDTFPPKMENAMKLYESRGFMSIEPYYANPHDDVLFMELAL